MNDPVKYGGRLAAEMKGKRRWSLVTCAVLFFTAVAGVVESLHAIHTGGTVSNRVGGIPLSGYEGAAIFGCCAILMGVFFCVLLRNPKGANNSD